MKTKRLSPTNNDPILTDLIARYPDLAPCRDSIVAAHAAMLRSVRGGGKILLCGNGGSASDCSHIAGELLKSLCSPRKLTPAQRRPFGKTGGDLADRLEGAIPAISLPDQGGIVSAFCNDSDPDYVYAQLTWGLGRKGDILWAISTSGNSPNVIHALRVARGIGMPTIGLLGRDGGRMKPLCDVPIIAPGRNTQEIQERHLPIYHALCMMLEASVFGRK